MIEQISKLMNEYSNWLRGKITLRMIGCTVEITTPFLDRHNDFIQIYVQKSGEDRFLLTDEGETIYDLEMSGISLDAPKRKNQLKVATAGFGVTVENSAMSVIASSQQFPLALHKLIQAILAVNDLHYTARQSIKQATIFDSQILATAVEQSTLPDILVESVVKDWNANRHMVFVSVDTDDKGTQIPKIQAISKVKRAIEEKFGKVTVIPVGRANDGISLSIKTMLFRTYPNEIRNVFSRVARKSVSVWVEPKSPTTKDRSDKMKEAVARFIGHFQLELIRFINTSEFKLPSETTCISTIRKKAPVTVPDISAELKRLGFEIPEEQWIVRNLDRWRKSNLIHRKTNGQFVMTYQGLKHLGTRINRSSPDVTRALDMARRER